MDTIKKQEHDTVTQFFKSRLIHIKKINNITDQPSLISRYALCCVLFILFYFAYIIHVVYSHCLYFFVNFLFTYNKKTSISSKIILFAIATYKLLSIYLNIFDILYSFIVNQSFFLITLC